MAENTYKIGNDRLTVELEALGGTFTSIRDSAGVEYLWQGDEAHWARRAPICFPICGSLKNGVGYTEDGRKVELPHHGFAKTSRFEAAEHTAEAVAFRLRDSRDTWKQYPFHFELCAKYELDGSCVSVTFEVKNTGDTPLPFSVGGHPGFNVPLLPGERFEDYYLEFEHSETVSVPGARKAAGLVDRAQMRPLLQDQRVLALTHKLFDAGSLQLEGLRSNYVALRSRTNPRSIRMDYGDFPVLLIWSSDNGGPFVALEPWAGAASAVQDDDRLAHKRYLQYAAPGESRSYRFSITIT